MSDKRIDNAPNDPVRRSQSECMRCGSESNLNTFAFRGRYLTACDRCHRLLQQ